MRIIVMLSILAIGLAVPRPDEPDNPDVYSLQTITLELRMRSGGMKVIHSWTQKQLGRLGDAVGIALLKVLSADDLQNAEKVKSLLPIVRDSFTHPEFISIESDKQPKVTLFLLNHLRQNISDAATLKDIDDTIEFIQQKTQRSPEG
jgi:hypothetical protein